MVYHGAFWKTRCQFRSVKSILLRETLCIVGSNSSINNYQKCTQPRFSHVHRNRTKQARWAPIFSHMFMYWEVHLHFLRDKPTITCVNTVTCSILGGTATNLIQTLIWCANFPFLDGGNHHFHYSELKTRHAQLKNYQYLLFKGTNAQQLGRHKMAVVAVFLKHPPTMIFCGWIQAKAIKFLCIVSVGCCETKVTMIAMGFSHRKKSQRDGFFLKTGYTPIHSLGNHKIFPMKDGYKW